MGLLEVVFTSYTVFTQPSRGVLTSARRGWNCRQIVIEDLWVKCVERFVENKCLHPLIIVVLPIENRRVDINNTSRAWCPRSGCREPGSPE